MSVEVPSLCVCGLRCALFMITLFFILAEAVVVRTNYPNPRIYHVGGRRRHHAVFVFSAVWPTLAAGFQEDHRLPSTNHVSR